MNSVIETIMKRRSVRLYEPTPIPKDIINTIIEAGNQAPFMSRARAAIGRARRKYLKEKAAKYSLQPVALGLFGGVWDFNKIPWWAGKAMAATKPKLVAAGFKEIKNGVYDTRDWSAIRCWAKELAVKVLVEHDKGGVRAHG